MSEGATGVSARSRPRDFMPLLQRVMESRGLAAAAIRGIIGQSARAIGVGPTAAFACARPAMSELEHNPSGFGGVMTPAETAAIDAGLRAYMVRVYTYMLIGLAITGFAALAIVVASVTDDLAHAAYFYNPFYIVASGSMIPTLNISDFVITNHNIPFSNLKVGDI